MGSVWQFSGDIKKMQMGKLRAQEEKKELKDEQMQAYTHTHKLLEWQLFCIGRREDH